jgi:hypothetical protein
MIGAPDFRAPLEARTFAVAFVILLAASLSFLHAAPCYAQGADATPTEFGATEVKQYAEATGATEIAAAQSLVLQESGSSAALQGALEESEDAEFAGLWFEPKTAEFVVPVVSRQERATANEVVQDTRLSGEASVVSVEFTWAELEEVQSRLDQEFAALLGEGFLLTAISPEDNAVVVNVGEEIPPEDLRSIKTWVGQLPIGQVLVKTFPAPKIEIGNLSCIGSGGICSKPLRGGQTLTVNGEPKCTMAFKAIGNVYGNRFALTAGHCVAHNGGTSGAWGAESTDAINHIIGHAEEFNFIPGDWAKINANGSWWDTNPWPSIVLEPGVNQEEPIEAESASYVGEMVCQDGFQTHRACGPVEYLNVSAENGQQHLAWIGHTCGNPGDSGAAITAGHVALGVLSGRIEPPPPCGEMVVLYNEITEVDEEMGVTVGPRLGSKPFAEVQAEAPAGPHRETLSGYANPHGIQSSVHGMFGVDGQPLSSATLPVGIGAGYQNTAVSVEATGLRGATTYRYDFVAENAAGAYESYGRKFTTPSWPPLVSGVSATPGKLSMTIQATIDGQGTSSHYHFEYGNSTGYGSSVPVPDENVGVGPATVSKVTPGEIEGTIHYRVAATNEEGTTYSPDQQVYVQERPTVVTEPVSSRIGTGATLNATVNPHGVESTYFFEYGLTAAYGSKTPQASAGSGSAAVPVGAEVSGLEFGSKYHYRIVATNWAGTRASTDRTFTPGWVPSSVPSLAGPYRESSLVGVSCVTETFCMGVGKYDTEALESQEIGVGDLWNGSEWTTERLPIEAPVVELSAVECASATSCEAVGWYNTGGINEYLPLALGWDGSGWKLQSPIPVAPGGSNTWSELLDLSCSAAANCEAVGLGYSLKTGVLAPLAEHWNGSQWEIQSIPSPAGAVFTALASVSCTSASSCVAVGPTDNKTPTYGMIAERWNGSSWSMESMPVPQGALRETESSISCVSASACEFAGSYESAPEVLLPYAERWNGSSWQVQPVPAPEGNLASRLENISCATASSCEAVGDYTTTRGGPTSYLVEQWKGTSWAVQEPYEPEHEHEGVLDGVSCVAANECMAVGKVAPEGKTLRRPSASSYFEHPPAIVVTKAATNVGEGSASLHGTVTPNRSSTEAFFEYGLTKAYGSKTAVQGAGAGITATEETAAIAGLNPGSEYHFRIAATNAGGTSYGKDLTFITPASGPSARLAAMATTDPFNGTASAISNYYEGWTALPWDSPYNPKGADASTGWGPLGPFPYVAGASYGPTVTDLGSGTAVAVTMAANPTLVERYFSVWLDLPSSPTGKTGYQLKFYDSATNKYTVSLVRWSSGTPTTLKEATNVSFLNGNSLALVDEGSTVSAWTNTGTVFTQLMSAPDSTYSSGTVAVEGVGNGTKLTNLRFGALQAKASGMSAALGELRLDDAFTTAESPLSEGGTWAALSWDYSGSGHSTGRVATGWGPYDALAQGINGAYWTKATFADTGSGDGVAATLTTNPGTEGHFELLLDMQNPATVRSGYELRFTETASSVYTVALTRWVAGVSTPLASKTGVSFAKGSRFALTDKGGTLAAWTAGASGEFTQLLTATDTTFTTGYVGVAGGGSATRISNFRGGPLAPF